jgi:hypothetical protein
VASTESVTIELTEQRVANVHLVNVPAIVCFRSAALSLVPVAGIFIKGKATYILGVIAIIFLSAGKWLTLWSRAAC